MSLPFQALCGLFVLRDQETDRILVRAYKSVRLGAIVLFNELFIRLIPFSFYALK